MPSAADDEYNKARAELVRAAEAAAAISKAGAGKFTNDYRLFWASVLFTRMCLMALSMLKLCPAPGTPFDKGGTWDLSSLASLVRNLAEAYFGFFDLCIDKLADEDEWLMRLNLIQLQDNRARHKMMLGFGGLDGTAAYETARDQLQAKLKSRRAFLALPARVQVELLKGDKALHTQDEILERMGEGESDFRGFYRYLCAHVHSSSVAFYRMAEQKRGSGLENEMDKGHMAWMIDIAVRFLDRATDDIAKSNGRMVARPDISRHA